jgi:hypothetical protein
MVSVPALQSLLACSVEPPVPIGSWRIPLLSKLLDHLRSFDFPVVKGRLDEAALWLIDDFSLDAFPLHSASLALSITAHASGMSNKERRRRLCVAKAWILLGPLAVQPHSAPPSPIFRSSRNAGILAKPVTCHSGCSSFSQPASPCEPSNGKLSRCALKRRSKIGIGSASLASGRLPPVLRPSTVNPP